MYECRTDEMRAARVADTVHGFVAFDLGALLLGHIVRQVVQRLSVVEGFVVVSKPLPGGESFRLRGGKDSTLRTGLFRRSGRGISRRFRADHIVFMDDDRQRRRGRCLRSRVGSRSTGPAPESSDTCPVERPETPAPNEGEARFEQRYDEHRVREFSSSGA